MTKPVASPSGKVGTIDPEFAREAEVAGVHPASAEEIAAARLASSVVTPAGQAPDFFEHPVDAYLSQTGANMAGLYRGLTMGLSDVALSKLGGDPVRQKLNQLREEHPIGSGVMEMGGMVGAMAAGNALVGAPAGASALGRVGIAATRGAAEMSLYEGGKAASEAALADEPITGQKIVAGMGHGAIIGALAGGGLGLLGEAAGAGVRALRRPGAARAAEEGGIGDWLQSKADEARIRDFGGTKTNIKNINRTVKGGVSTVAREAGAYTREFSEPAEKLASVTRGIKDLGGEQRGMLAALDNAKVGIAPDVQRFAAAVESDVIAPRMMQRVTGEWIPRPGSESAVASAREWLDGLKHAYDGKAPQFGEWAKMRMSLDDQIANGFATKSPSTSTLRQIRGLMEKELDVAGETAAKQMGGAFVDKYRATQQTLQSLIKTQEMLEGAVAGGARNNYLSLTSRLAGFFGGAVGTALGGPAGGLAGGLAGATLGRLAQSRGDALAADLLERAAGILGARRLISRADATMLHGVQQLVGKAPKNSATSSALAVLGPPARSVAAPLGVKLTGDRRKDYTAISGQLTTAAGNQVATSERLGHAMGDLPTHAPAAAKAVIDTTFRGTAFLLSKMPPSRKDEYSIQPQLQHGTRASDAEISRFMRYAEAVDDPMLVLKEAKAGTLTRDHVEAVKAVYPDLYEEMRLQVMRSLTETSAPLPYQRRIQLGILLDIPTDSTLAPDFVQAIQATYSSAEKAGAETPPPPSRELNIASGLATPMQSATREGLEK